MNMLVAPTIVNPDSLDTVTDLRRELHRANEVMVRQLIRISHADKAGEQVAAAMEGVLRAHICNEAAVVADRLDAYLAERPRLREHLEEQLESERIRKVH